MNVEVDTSIEGVCMLLLALTEINLLDLHTDERLLRELYRRCGMGTRGFEYTPDRVDTWTTFAVLADPKRTPPDAPMRADCEDYAAMWGAYLVLRGAPRVAVCVTQPREDAMAHAYLRIASVADDPALRAVMDPYSLDSGEGPMPIV